MAHLSHKHGVLQGYQSQIALKIGLPQCLSLLSQSGLDATTLYAKDNTDWYFCSLELSLGRHWAKTLLSVEYAHWPKERMGFPSFLSCNWEISDHQGQLSSLSWSQEVSEWLLFLIWMCMLLSLSRFITQSFLSGSVKNHFQTRKWREGFLR